MKKVQYNIAIRTYMEVFDYLINNGFIYDSDKNFLRSRIKIDEDGFIEETQSRRGVWEDKTTERVSTDYVLYVLTNIIDSVLTNMNVPTTPQSGYAYINDTIAKLNGPRQYYKSYRQILAMLKTVKDDSRRTASSDDKIIDIGMGVVKLHGLKEKLKQLTPLEIRTVECYARLEEKTIYYTSCLLFYKYVDRVNSLGKSRLWYNYRPFCNIYGEDETAEVDWRTFKNEIISNYQDQGGHIALTENKGKSLAKSVLGLNGRTI